MDSLIEAFIAGCKVVWLKWPEDLQNGLIKGQTYPSAIREGPCWVMSGNTSCRLCLGLSYNARSPKSMLLTNLLFVRKKI